MRKTLLKLAFAIGMLWVTSAVISMHSAQGGPVFETTLPSTGAQEDMLWVELWTEDGVKELPMEEYIAGVLISEMPADFHSEAKKAQAIAARTFALRTAQTGLKHGAGMICANPECCQGYLTLTEYLSKGGSTEGYQKAWEAAKATENLVITYDGALIDATYFSCSGGRTEAAVAVWGSDIPYLQAVDSPGEEDSLFYANTVYFTARELEEALNIRLTDGNKNWIKDVSYTDGGGIQSMVIGGIKFSGAQLRKLLGLRSQSLTATVLSTGVLITTRGWGHRVGLSQYGAEAMAQNGSSFEEILTHYYQGVELETYGQ